MFQSNHLESYIPFVASNPIALNANEIKDIIEKEQELIAQELKNLVNQMKLQKKLV